MRTAFGLVLGVLLLLGCGGRTPGPIALGATASTTPEASVTSTATATSTSITTATEAATSTTTPTPVATATETPTPTPTPTALSVLVSGNLRRAILTTPVPRSGAPCGVVGTLDYPLNPPHAEGIFRGHDFGAYRSHYGGYHTGEDWWGPGGQSLGMPVYSIGHGLVTYAAPRGWGTDGGTVVVQHVLPDGRTLLSFYGHLSPSSVTLRAGDCVARGERLGRIGRPSSPPHLHFEIRTHLPGGPGPGYWPTDPTQAGWLPPSQTIWDYRISTSPGVLWTRPSAAWSTRGLGMLDADTFLAIEGDRLLGIDALDGSLRWSAPSAIRATDGVIDPSGSLVYTANHYTGRAEAFRIQDVRGGSANTGSASPLAPVWQIKLDATGSVTLMPLPGGGVVTAFREGMFALSASGDLLWEHDAPAQALDWVWLGGRLIFSTIGEGGKLWTADEAGPTAQVAPESGHLVIADDRLLVYGEDGVYRLDASMRSADLLHALPRSRLEQGDAIALPDGGLLLTHVDAFDRRLIALNADGTLRWQRSYNRFVRGNEFRPLVLDGHPFIVSHRRAGTSSELSVFALDLKRETLTRLFALDGWYPRPGERWACRIGDGKLLLNVGIGTGSGRLVAFDTQLALETVGQVTDSQ